MIIEAHHIIPGIGRRHDDRREVVMLCSLCHKLAHGLRCVIDGAAMPKITLAELLWLKKKFDGKFYDRKYLAGLWLGGRLPRAKRPSRGKWAKQR